MKGGTFMANTIVTW